MKKFTQRFLSDDKGVTAIEYGLIAGLIVLVIATAVTTLGTDLKTVFTNISNSITGTSAAS
ncbi:Flp family type IVb pilin [Paraburkholderia sp. MMS20-SJTR3]|uniref:Flp family type IVb pilin n=1 Tax=Paraburkholderia sejongensis TaxID=2886946 RepID=A0ABS8JMN3_9BURK|nr:Flp family type IVb pilin [Paraburkholderia sp. MMS20-SJTR3]MCC8391165.1 Flp family type IVb pilin [Paraburkholderia sp. MMS20-SJTR3]